MTLRRFAAIAMAATWMVLLAASAVVLGLDDPAIEREWTVMLYFNGDDPLLESDFINAFVDMAEAQVGSTDRINIVAQFDRIPGYDSRYGDWEICHRYFVSPGLLPTEDAAIKDWGDNSGGREVPMDSPETLTRFIEWASSVYPARRYALIVADHGFSFKGLSIDATSDENFMFLTELRDAVLSAGVSLDLLGLDACNMQTVEVAYELRSTGIGTIVGSQNPGDTWPFSGILASLALTPDMTAELLGQTIVDLYIEAHPTSATATLSVLNLDEVESLAELIRILGISCEDGSSIASIQQHAQSVLDQLARMILYSRSNGEWRTAAHGLSIYFPPGSGGFRPQFFSYYYIGKLVAFAREVGWRDLLNGYFDPLGSKIILDPVVWAARSGLPLLGTTECIDLYEYCRAIVDYEP